MTKRLLIVAVMVSLVGLLTWRTPETPVQWQCRSENVAEHVEWNCLRLTDSEEVPLMSGDSAHMKCGVRERCMQVR